MLYNVLREYIKNLMLMTMNSVVTCIKTQRSKGVIEKQTNVNIFQNNIQHDE